MTRWIASTTSSRYRLSPVRAKSRPRAMTSTSQRLSRSPSSGAGSGFSAAASRLAKAGPLCGSSRTSAAESHTPGCTFCAPVAPPRKSSASADAHESRRGERIALPHPLHQSLESSAHPVDGFARGPRDGRLALVDDAVVDQPQARKPRLACEHQVPTPEEIREDPARAPCERASDEGNE